MVLGFVSLFGSIFGFIFGFDPTLTGLLGFGTIIGVLSFLSLVEKHGYPNTTGPEVDLSTLLFITMRDETGRTVIG